MSMLASGKGMHSAGAATRSAAAQPAEMATCLVEIAARQVQALQVHGRIGQRHLPQETTGSAGRVSVMQCSAGRARA